MPRKPFFVVASQRVLSFVRLTFSRPALIAQAEPIARWEFLQGSTWQPARAIRRFHQYVDVFFQGLLGLPTQIRYAGSPPLVRSVDWVSLAAFPPRPIT